MIPWQEEEIIFAPLNGRIIPLEEVPNPTFSHKFLGDGIAIMPNDGQVVAPVDGRVANIFRSKHAIGILSNKGVEILIHVGLETVLLNGEGFTVHVKRGEMVKRGDLLLSFHLKTIKKRAASLLTPVIITNHEQAEITKIASRPTCVAGQSALLRVMVTRTCLFRVK
ncbi:PTS system, glucose subfamily, IIA component domain protein [Anoxybacillus sp. B7M1]|jgi:sugar PTS system EIIA component|uniref:PTS glucose transporter subunit IIA n=1 Tax=Anoxybacteroides rupiense TaxID=311460 RepID=A0ABD5IW90_9BACL|nr:MULTISPECIES: PTS glucose transporter subunit IIA [Anoxybacillus]ANB56300.1 PTS system, glucose subfamily, IIA component domain protein [Anoxybacillus sp. B2M1]ANB65358.1 PTS system, glucose subfamily, IIA component domain protein [Anoxybacillus sp. B7M1]KXG09293.1 Glucose-specific phosphotransferase enzyme IIA component [Anoxybacillus sp. P3H1B]MBB3905750.1 glucose-specific phosphotransferase system IIA component [Anoxybacillus rupiensis]MBS2772604.1 PTS glucose transporter subunit IIA [An